MTFRSQRESQNAAIGKACGTPVSPISDRSRDVDVVSFCHAKPHQRIVVQKTSKAADPPDWDRPS